MILSPGPSTRAHFARAEPLPGESIMPPPLRGPADSPATLRGLWQLSDEATFRLSSFPAQEEPMAAKLDHRMTAPAALDHRPGPARRRATGNKNTVKARLIANRPWRVVENDDYAAPRPSLGDGRSERSSPRPGRQSPTPEPPGRQGLTAIGPRADPCRPGEPGVAHRVPDRGDDLSPRQCRARICARDVRDRAELRRRKSVARTRARQPPRPGGVPETR